MDEQEYIQKLKNIEEKVNEIDERTKEIRKTQVIRFVIALILFFLPLIAIIFSIPFLMDILETYGGYLP